MTVAWDLHGLYEAFQIAVTVPGVVVQTQVLQVGHGDQGLLAHRAQLVVLQEQSLEAPQALEGPFLHHRDLVLLQIQTLEALKPGEGSVAYDPYPVAGQKKMFGLLRPAVGARDGDQTALLAVQKDVPGLQGLGAVREN